MAKSKVTLEFTKPDWDEIESALADRYGWSDTIPTSPGGPPNGQGGGPPVANPESRAQHAIRRVLEFLDQIREGQSITPAVDQAKVAATVSEKAKSTAIRERTNATITEQ